MELCWTAALIVAFLCCRLQKSSACNLTQQNDRWISYGNVVSVVCTGIPNRKWWIVSDPCHLSEGRVLSECSSSTICDLSSETYLSMEACIVCCTESAVTELSQETVHACETIRVCPVVDVTIPSLTTTGGTLNVETVVATKPRPQPNSISLTVTRVVSDGENIIFIPLGSETDGVGYRVPTTMNNYSFFHSIAVPWNFSAADLLRVTIDTTGIQRGAQECGTAGQVFDETVRVVKVNRPITEVETPIETSATSSSEVATRMITTEDFIANTGFDYPSLGIGAAVGVFATILVLSVLLALVLFRRKLARSHSSKSASLEVTGHHLLTANGTPATTPSSCCEKRVPGYSSAQDTPATTPTEGDSLLNGTSQQGPLNPPPLPDSAAQCSNPSYFSTEFSGPAMPKMMTTGQPPPLHQPPLTLNHRSPPTSLHGPPRPLPTLSPPQLSHPSQPHASQHTSSDSRPSTLDPAYSTHGEAIYLSKIYNDDPGVMV